MLGLCMRYVGAADAEDVLIDAFFKVFDKLDMYTGEGSFAGWVRRIVVNEALMHLRKRKRRPQTDELLTTLPVADTRYTAADRLQADDILRLLEQLPDGYRTVFNLYVLEGYKHREIAEMLGISINTSKSQLILARKRMRDRLTELGVGAAVLLAGVLILWGLGALVHGGAQ